jgi:hypothetical protein
MEAGMDPYELQERQHLAEEVADSIKRALPRTRTEVEPVIGDADASSPAEKRGKLDEARQVRA